MPSDTWYVRFALDGRVIDGPSNIKRSMAFVPRALRWVDDHDGQTTDAVFVAVETQADVDKTQAEALKAALAYRREWLIDRKDLNAQQAAVASVARETV